MKNPQNWLNVVKAALKRKFINLDAYITNGRRWKINDVIFLIKKPKKQIQPKVSEGKEIIKIRAAINDIKNKSGGRFTTSKASFWKTLIILISITLKLIYRFNIDPSPRTLIYRS